jgi:hypothetical protein
MKYLLSAEQKPSYAVTEVDWDLKFNDVQDFWNFFECKLLDIIDIIVPLTEFLNNEVK